MGRSQPAGNSLQYLPGGPGESLSRLLEASLAPSTRAHYQRAWGKLVTFFKSLGMYMYPSLPIPVAMILLFVAHLHAGGAAPATIVSNVSALAYFRKINGLPDPTSNFIVVKLLAGARNLGSVPDVRLPACHTTHPFSPGAGSPHCFRINLYAHYAPSHDGHCLQGLFASRRNGAQVEEHDAGLLPRGRCHVDR